MGVPVYLDNLSHLNDSQILKLNSVFNAEYKRFQRKAYQKENNTEPNVSSTVKVLDTKVHDFTTRSYNGLTTAAFLIDTSNMEQNKGYKILETEDTNPAVSYTVFDSKEMSSSINEAIAYSKDNNIIFAPITDTIKKQYYVYLFWLE